VEQKSSPWKREEPEEQGGARGTGRSQKNREEPVEQGGARGTGRSPWNREEPTVCSS